jgi:hypothetical protein
MSPSQTSRAIIEAEVGSAGFALGMETCVAHRRLIAVLLATAVLGTLSGCGMYANPGASDLAPRTPSARTSGLESLALAGYSGSGYPQVGEVLPPSQYEVFLTGHVDSISRPAPGDSSSTSSGEVDVVFDVQGTNALIGWTTSHIGRWMVVLLNGRVVSARLLDKQVTDGRLSIPVDPDSSVGQEMLRILGDS